MTLLEPIPLDIIECISNELNADGDCPALQALALACVDYMFICQRHLFRHVNLESTGNIPQRHSRLHSALEHHSHLGGWVKTLTICLPDYNGHILYATGSPHLPDTLLRLRQLQAVHITHLPTFDTDESWVELKGSLLHLFSLPTLAHVALEFIWGFPIEFLDFFSFVRHLHFKHVSFASSPSLALGRSTNIPLHGKNRLKSLAFHFCPSQTLQWFIDYVHAKDSILCIDDVESLIVNPWTEHSSPLAVEILGDCGERVKEIVWALGSLESCTCHLLAFVFISINGESIQPIAENIRVDDLPSLEHLTLILNFDDRENDIFASLIRLLDGLSLPSRVSLDIDIRLILPTSPLLAHDIFTSPSSSYYHKWLALDNTLSDLGKRCIVRRLEFEFVCPCLPSHGFHGSRVRTGERGEVGSREIEGELLGDWMNTRLEKSTKEGALGKAYVTHKIGGGCDKVCCRWRK